MTPNLLINSARGNIPIMYFSYYSPPARAAYMVAKALNIEIQLKDADILSTDYLTPELLKINPQHTIPTLVDGKHVIWDSHAIAGYLVHQYSSTFSLYPNFPPHKRALIDQRLHFDTEILFPKTLKAIYPLLFRNKTEIPPKTRTEVVKVYDLLEKFLEDSTWLAGEELTIADLCCVSSISSLDYVINVTDTEHPKLYEYLQRCSKLPYYEEANQFGVDMLGKKIQESILSAYFKSTSRAQPYKMVSS